MGVALASVCGGRGRGRVGGYSGSINQALAHQRRRHELPLAAWQWSMVRWRGRGCGEGDWGIVVAIVAGVAVASSSVSAACAAAAACFALLVPLFIVSALCCLSSRTVRVFFPLSFFYLYAAKALNASAAAAAAG